MTSEPFLFWPKTGDRSFQLETKREKKIVLLFNLESILVGSALGGPEKGVLGIKWEKGIDYFSFRFHICE